MIFITSISYVPRAFLFDVFLLSKNFWQFQLDEETSAIKDLQTWKT